MADDVLAAVRIGPRQTELRTFAHPDVGHDSALLRVDVAGVCGTDVKMYNSPPFNDPVIMGHENIGTIVEAGPGFVERQGMRVGDRVFVEHYVGCYQCEWCRQGDYRHCPATDWRNNPNARRFGYTSSDNPPHLWGGFAQYMYLPWNTVAHKVPDEIDTELAGLATPLSNGIEWALFDCGVGYNSSVLIQGPGQQGLAQTVACKQAGASTIVVTGTFRDAARLEVARKLGADHVIVVDEGSTLEQIQDITKGRGVDVVLDCTAGAGNEPVLLGIDALKWRGGVLLVQGEKPTFPDFPIGKLTVKGITLKSARGHSFRACELALAQLASRRFPLELLTTHTFALDEVDLAIRSVGGESDEDVIHVSLLPWKKTAA